MVGGAKGRKGETRGWLEARWMRRIGRGAVRMNPGRKEVGGGVGAQNGHDWLRRAQEGRLGAARRGA